MSSRETLLAAMRRNLRRVAPALIQEGWSQEDVAEISVLVRAHLAAGDDEALSAVAKWLADRAWPILEREMAEYDRRRASEFAVTHDERALREMNRNWSRVKELERGEADGKHG